MKIVLGMSWLLVAVTSCCAAANKKVLWQFSPRDSHYFQSAPAIGRDGTVYIGNQNGTLYALSSAGKVKWHFRNFPGDFGVHTQPTIAQDGTIYIGAWGRGLTAVSPSGFRKWEFGADVAGHSGIAVGSDGTIYFLCAYNSGAAKHLYPDQHLYAVTPSGETKWKFPLQVGEGRKPVVTKEHVFAIEGRFYGIPKRDDELLALNLSGEPLWRRKGVVTEPAIGPDGTLYVGIYGDYLAAFKPTGELIWFTKVLGGVAATPSIDTNGTLYFGTHDGYVCAVNKRGKLLWASATSGQVGYCGNMSSGEIAGLRAKFAERKRPEHQPIRFPVALTDKGDVIAAAHPGVVAFNADGKKLWELELEGRAGAAFTISTNRVIFINQRDNGVVAIQGDSGTGKGSRPMVARDPAHTSFAD